MHSVSYEFAGLGGTVGFNKITGETAWYYPLIWKFVGVLHGKAGYVKELEGMNLPDYEKFYMSGMGGLRGFERDDLAPRDDDGNIVGADRFVVGNVELRYPLFEGAGLYGAVFFDTGEAWGKGEKVDLVAGGHPWGRFLWGTVGFWIPNPPTKLPGIGSFPWPRLSRCEFPRQAGFSISL
jgi:outer membrane protein insertion porin family